MTPQEKRAHEYAKKASLCPREFDARFEGYLQAEKDLALTWKKSSLPFKFPRIYNGMLVWDGYEISLNALKKLPKEE